MQAEGRLLVLALVLMSQLLDPLRLLLQVLQVVERQLER